jgi:integrase
MTATVRKRGAHWQADIIVTLPSGTRVRERRRAPGTTRSAALRWAQQRETAILAGPVTQKIDAPTLNAYWPTFLATHVDANREKHSSKRARESIFRMWLSPRFGSMRLDAISTEAVQRLKGDLSARSPKTANNVLVCLSTVLKAARDAGHLSTLPTIKLVKVDTGKTPDAYSTEMQERIVAAAEGQGTEALVTVLLGLDAGLRRGEVIALDVSDVRDGKLVVSRASYRGVISTTKGGQMRTVPMTPRLAAAVAAAACSRTSGRLLLDATDEGIRWTMECIERAVGIPPTKKTQQGRAKWPGHFHILRHTFCSNLAARGVPAIAIQRLAGHVSIETTQKYLHMLPGAAEAAIATLASGSAACGGGTGPVDRGTGVEQARPTLGIVKDFAA